MSLMADSVGTIIGSGSMLVSFDGEMQRLSVDVICSSSTHFRGFLYGPFGNLVAALRAGSDSAALETQQSEYRIGRKDPIAFLPYFTRYPFTFDELARILCGKLFLLDVLGSEADSVFAGTDERRGDETRLVQVWDLDTVTVRVITAPDTGFVDLVQYQSFAPEVWTLTMRRFRGGIAREITFEQDELNYFTLVYDRVRLRGESGEPATNVGAPQTGKPVSRLRSDK